MCYHHVLGLAGEPAELLLWPTDGAESSAHLSGVSPELSRPQLSDKGHKFIVQASGTASFVRVVTRVNSIYGDWGAIECFDKQARILRMT